MPRRAMSSSSQVDTPGLAASHTWSRIAAATSPASRMRRISSLDLRWIRTADRSTRARRDAAANARTLGPREAFVVSRDEVRLDLLHRIERHTDDDQQTGSTEVERDLHVLLQ